MQDEMVMPPTSAPDDSAGSASPVVALRALEKSFGPTRAVDDLDLDLLGGVVHALLGENGAGKSTAAKVAAGVISPTSGVVILDGEPTAFTSPRDAERAGIVLIPQELQLFGPLSVVENLYVGRPRPRNRWGVVSRREMKATAIAVLDKLGLDLDVRKPVELLSPAARQLVAIARALVVDTRLLIMDEPTSSLDEWESERLLNVVREVKASGVGVLYVTHRLNEVREIADVVTVMRDGRAVAQGPAGEFDDETIVYHMVGRPVAALSNRTSVARENVVLEVRNLTARTGFRNVSFRLFEGEVLGIAGLLGAGRTHLAEALFGALPTVEGEVKLHGNPVRLRSVGAAVSAGIGYVPQERQSEGLFMTLEATKNASFVVAPRFKRGWFLDERRERKFASDSMEPLNVKGVIDEPVHQLSGGNQQKVVVAKWLATEPSVLLLNEPTRGVDVAVRAEIYRIIDDLARQGVGVIVISSEMMELRMLSDRILVMRDGEIVAEFAGEDASDMNIGRAVLGRAEKSVTP